MGSFGCIDQEFGSTGRPINVVAQYWDAAGPLPLSALGGDLVPDSLTDDLALELGNESRTFSVSRRRLFGHSKRLVSRERTTGLIGFSRFGKTFGPSLANWHQRALQNALLGSQLPPVVNSAQLWALWNTG
jgi:hypothetical protein